jgi:hypothetical protein
MKNRLTLLTCAVLGAALCAPASAQDWKGRGRAQGRVVDEAGEPIAGASVRLYTGLGKSGPAPFLTNKKGSWSHLGLKLGMWTVEITAEGITVTPLGRVFVRAVAAVFDRYLQERRPTAARYSRVV